MTTRENPQDLFWIIEAEQSSNYVYFKWNAKATAVSKDGTLLHTIRITRPRETRLEAVGAMEAYCVLNQLTYTLDKSLEEEIQPLENADSEENRADLANDADIEELLFRD